MTIDVVEALQSGKVVEVTRKSKAGETRGWLVAESIIRERVPLWLVAAGLEVPELPAGGGFETLPQILAFLDALPVRPAIHASIEQRALGQRLAAQTQAGPLAAVLTALGHAGYSAEDERELCQVQNALERTLPMLGTLAAARHEQLTGGLDGFDLAAWQQATALLADDLTP